MGIIYSHARRDSAQVLQQKILSLLTKGAIQIVPLEKSQCGFYSKYFPMLKMGPKQTPQVFKVQKADTHCPAANCVPRQLAHFSQPIFIYKYSICSPQEVPEMCLPWYNLRVYGPVIRNLLEPSSFCQVHYCTFQEAGHTCCHIR